MKQTIYLSDGSKWEAIISPPPPSGKKLAWIKPDWMTYYWHFDIRWNNLTKSGRGTPCVFNGGNRGSAQKYNALTMNPTRLDRQAQTVAADLLAIQKYGLLFRDLVGEAKNYIIRAFTALYGTGLAYTNKNGFGDDSDPRANFIANTDLRAELPKMFALIDGTCTYEIEEEDADYVKIASWKEGQLPTNYGVEILQNHRVSWCTIIKPTVPQLIKKWIGAKTFNIIRRYFSLPKFLAAPGAGYSVFQFPQLHGISVPRPLITKDDLYYWKDEVVIYDPPRKGLYWPERN